MEAKNLKLKKAIRAAFDTQREFARRLGVEESVVSNAISGVRPIKDEATQKKWAKKLKVEVSEIF